MPEIHAPEPTVEFHRDEDHNLLIRIDDQANLEFWMQLEIDPNHRLIQAQGRHLHPADLDANAITVLNGHTGRVTLRVRDAINPDFGLHLHLVSDRATVTHLFHPTTPVWEHFTHRPNPNPYRTPNRDRVSERKVLKSAAGYYIGRTSYDPDDAFYPWSRESFEYYETEQDAQEALDQNTFSFRPSPVS